MKESFPTPIPQNELEPNIEVDLETSGPLDQNYFDLNVHGTLLPTLEKYIQEKKDSTDPETQKGISRLNQNMQNTGDKTPLE